MSKKMFVKGSAAAIGAVAIGAMSLSMGGVASAATGTSYQANLQQINNSGASGNLTLQLDGDQATITESVSGLPGTFMGKPYPHVQHIHIGGKGMCPTPSADVNGDGVISTTEGGPAYGMVGTTLSVSGDTSAKAATDLTIAPSGASYKYSRTITLDAASLASVKAGTAVIVVHGLDPATLSQQAQGEPSDLVPTLPLAATSPALCGALQASQMTTTPNGAADTGGGSTAGIEDRGLLAAGGGLLLAAAGIGFAGRRRYSQN
ncbi:MAG: hypothetical protein ABI137_04525 [Antricoccus sp.]